MSTTPDETGPRAALNQAFRDRLTAASRLSDATALRRQAIAELKEKLAKAADSAFTEWQSTWGALPADVTITMLPVEVYGGAPVALATRVYVTLK